MTPRNIEVDMSSQAIDARLREVAQLRKLGLSIAKAKPILPRESIASKTAIDLSKSAECETAPNRKCGDR